MADTTTELPPQTNGITIDSGPDDEERARMRPADIDADVKEMERRKRVDMIMSSKLFREELERIIEHQMRDGSGTASGLMQQISDMMGVPKNSGNAFKSSNCVVPINDIRGIEAMGYAKGEKILRCKLAAVYRLVDLYGWSQGCSTFITARLNQDEEHFLVNPYGMLFHEITASSLIKVDMQGQVVEQGTTNFSVNISAFSLHAAIHSSRPDIKCTIHVRTPSVVAVSAVKCGILPVSEQAVVIGETSTHSHMGGVLNTEEIEKIARNLGPNNKVLILQNQGAVCCGETIEEAFFNARNTVLACEQQLKLMPIGLDNLLLISDEQRKVLYDAAHRPPESTPRPDQPSILEGKVERKWRVGGVDFEALMRMLDNAGFRTGYIYRHPLVKGEPPKPRNDVEVPPAVSSLGYLLEEEELYRQGLWKKLEGGRKGHDRTRWLNSPNVYQKVEILETGTPDPKKITKWVADASPTHSSTPVKIEHALQFVPKNTNPKEFKKLQQQIKDYRRADKISAGPQSHILEGVTWEEAKKMQDATVTQTGDQVVLMGAASKGIIQRGFQHNATMYKSPYAKNPFDSVTDEELDEYKRVVERKAKGEFDDTTDYSESEGLSSAQINKRISDIRSPTSVTSETEEESRDEPQVLRIQTTQAPKPSQPEIVMSDDEPMSHIRQDLFLEKRLNIVAYKTNAAKKQDSYYRTSSFSGLPRGSYLAPNPTHYHLARFTNTEKLSRPKLVKVLPNGRYSNFNARASHGFNFFGPQRPTITINLGDSRSLTLDIPFETLRGFILPFATALNLGDNFDFRHAASQTSYINERSNVSIVELPNNKSSSSEESIRSDESDIMKKIHEELLSDHSLNEDGDEDFDASSKIEDKLDETPAQNEDPPLEIDTSSNSEDQASNNFEEVNTELESFLEELRSITAQKEMQDLGDEFDDDASVKDFEALYPKEEDLEDFLNALVNEKPEPSDDKDEEDEESSTVSWETVIEVSTPKKSNTVAQKSSDPAKNEEPVQQTSSLYGIPDINTEAIANDQPWEPQIMDDDSTLTKSKKKSVRFSLEDQIEFVSPVKLEDEISVCDSEDGVSSIQSDDDVDSIDELPVDSFELTQRLSSLKAQLNFNFLDEDDRQCEDLPQNEEHIKETPQIEKSKEVLPDVEEEVKPPLTLVTNEDIQQIADEVIEKSIEDNILAILEDDEVAEVTVSKELAEESQAGLQDVEEEFKQQMTLVTNESITAILVDDELTEVRVPKEPVEKSEELLQGVGEEVKQPIPLVTIEDIQQIADKLIDKIIEDSIVAILEDDDLAEVKVSKELFEKSHEVLQDVEKVVELPLPLVTNKDTQQIADQMIDKTIEDNILAILEDDEFAEVTVPKELVEKSQEVLEDVEDEVKQPITLATKEDIQQIADKVIEKNIEASIVAILEDDEIAEVRVSKELPEEYQTVLQDVEEVVKQPITLVTNEDIIAILEDNDLAEARVSEESVEKPEELLQDIEEEVKRPITVATNEDIQHLADKMIDKIIEDSIIAILEDDELAEKRVFKELSENTHEVLQDVEEEVEQPLLTNEDIAILEDEDLAEVRVSKVLAEKSQVVFQDVEEEVEQPIPLVTNEDIITMLEDDSLAVIRVSKELKSKKRLHDAEEGAKQPIPLVTNEDIQQIAGKIIDKIIEDSIVAILEDDEFADVRVSKELVETSQAVLQDVEEEVKQPIPLATNEDVQQIADEVIEKSIEDIIVAILEDDEIAEVRVSKELVENSKEVLQDVEEEVKLPITLVTNEDIIAILEDDKLAHIRVSKELVKKSQEFLQDVEEEVKQQIPLVHNEDIQQIADETSEKSIGSKELVDESKVLQAVEEQVKYPISFARNEDIQQALAGTYRMKTGEAEAIQQISKMIRIQYAECTKGGTTENLTDIIDRIFDQMRTSPEIIAQIREIVEARKELNPKKPSFQVINDTFEEIFGNVLKMIKREDQDRLKSFKRRKAACQDKHAKDKYEDRRFAPFSAPMKRRRRGPPSDFVLLSEWLASNQRREPSFRQRTVDYIDSELITPLNFRGFPMVAHYHRASTVTFEEAKREDERKKEEGLPVKILKMRERDLLEEGVKRKESKEDLHKKEELKKKEEFKKVEGSNKKEEKKVVLNRKEEPKVKKAIEGMQACKYHQSLLGSEEEILLIRRVTFSIEELCAILLKSLDSSGNLKPDPFILKDDLKRIIELLGYLPTNRDLDMPDGRAVKPKDVSAFKDMILKINKEITAIQKGIKACKHKNRLKKGQVCYKGVCRSTPKLDDLFDVKTVEKMFGKVSEMKLFAMHFKDFKSTQRSKWEQRKALEKVLFSDPNRVRPKTSVDDRGLPKPNGRSADVRQTRSEETLPRENAEGCCERSGNAHATYCRYNLMTILEQIKDDIARLHMTADRQTLNDLWSDYIELQVMLNAVPVFCVNCSRYVPLADSWNMQIAEKNDPEVERFFRCRRCRSFVGPKCYFFLMDVLAAMNTEERRMTLILVDRLNNPDRPPGFYDRFRFGDIRKLVEERNREIAQGRRTLVESVSADLNNMDTDLRRMRNRPRRRRNSSIVKDSPTAKDAIAKESPIAKASSIPKDSPMAKDYPVAKDSKKQASSSNCGDTSSYIDEGISLDSKASSSCDLRAFDKKIEELSSIIFDCIVKQCYEIKDLILFPEVFYDENIDKMFVVLKAAYTKNYPQISDVEKNELRIDLAHCVLQKIEMSNINDSEEAQVISDKLFTISEFISDVLDKFFDMVSSFESFSTPLKEEAMKQSTPKKPSRKDTPILKKPIAKKPISKQDKDLVAFKAKKSLSGNELYWISMPKESKNSLDVVTTPKKVINVDDIPLKPPPDLTQVHRVENSRRSLSPIKEEPRVNLKGQFLETQLSTYTENYEFSDYMAGGDYIPFERPDDNVIVSNEAKFFRSSAAKRAAYIQSSSITFVVNKNDGDGVECDEGNWMGYEKAKF